MAQAVAIASWFDRFKRRKSGEPLIAARVLPLLIIAFFSALAWQVAPPEGLDVHAYKTAVVFIATIAAIVANVMPTGAVAICAVAVYAILRPGGEEVAAAAINNAIGNFNNALIWLIVVAFMIARAFSKTGLADSAQQVRPVFPAHCLLPGRGRFSHRPGNPQ